MFVCTVRGSSVRFLLLLVLSVTAFLAIVLLGGQESVFAMADGETIRYSGVKSEEARIDFLKQFEIEVAPESVKEESFTMGESLDRVLLGYNEMQKKQGLDLSKYTRKRVTRYTYRVTNSPAEGEVYVNLLIYRGRVIAGDVASADPDGFVMPLCDFTPKK